MRQLNTKELTTNFLYFKHQQSTGGKPFNLLIDSGSTHSFISPKCIRNLNLPEQHAPHVSVELAIGKITKSTTTMGELKFLLNDQPTTTNF